MQRLSDRRGLCLGAALTFSLFVASCGKKQSEENSSADTTQAAAKVAVEATEVISGNVPEELVATGHTEATREENIVSPIAGKLLELNGLEEPSSGRASLWRRFNRGRPY